MCSVISGSLEVEPKVEILVEVVWWGSSLMWNRARGKHDSTEEEGRQRRDFSGNLAPFWSRRDLWLSNCIRGGFALRQGGVFYAQSPSPFLPLSTNHQLQQALG